MQFRFIGDYTNGHTSVFCNGVTFHDREPAEVPGEAVATFKRHPEYEAVEEAAPEPVVETPKRRGRPRKAD